MKKLLYLCILSLLSIASCNNPKTAEHPEKPKSPKDSPTEFTGNICTDSGYQIYKETAIMWENSWQATFLPNSTNRQSLTFSESNIDSLKSMVSGSEGIRLYYCFVSSTTIPSLAMVNIIGCNNEYGDDQNPVLFSDHVAGEYFGSIATLESTAGAWKDTVDNKDLAIHTPVYAYNYSWEELFQTNTPLEPTTLYVTFGLRTLSADEYDEFHCQPATNNISILQNLVLYIAILHF